MPNHQAKHFFSESSTKSDGWCWFVLREKYCWLVAGGWFVLREKYCWLVADKPSEQDIAAVNQSKVQTISNLENISVPTKST
jgi:hypothetical protein